VVETFLVEGGSLVAMAFQEGAWAFQEEDGSQEALEAFQEEV